MRSFVALWSALILIGFVAQRSLSQTQPRGMSRVSSVAGSTTRPSGVSIESEGPPPAGHRYALCIGIDNYNPDSGYPVLHCAVADARSLGEIFAALGYRTTVMTDDGGGIGKDAKPDTRHVPNSANIIRELQEFARNASNPDDELVISFAGHGDIVNNQSAIVPIDYTKSANNLVTVSRILDPLNDPQCRARSKLLLLDACHSGKVDKAFFVNFIKEKNLMVFSACSAGQSSMEDEADGHGRFTQALIWGLVGKGFKVPTTRPGDDAAVAEWNGGAYGPGADFLTFDQLSKYVGDTFTDEKWSGKSASHQGVSDEDPNGQNPHTFGEQDTTVPMIVSRRKVSTPPPQTEEDQKTIDATMAEANFAYSKHDWLVMIHHANTVLRIRDGYADALALRAMANLHATYVHLADDDAQAALRADPYQAMAMQACGMCADARNDKKQARECLEAADRLVNANPGKWASLARGEDAVYRRVALAMVADDGPAAMDRLVKLANSPDLPRGTVGDVAAVIAQRYRDGEGIPPDKTKAMEWYQKASEAGNSAATLAAGTLYEENHDYSKAMNQYTRAADAGQQEATYKIASLYEGRVDLPPENDKAMEGYRRLAASGDAPAMNRIGWMTENGYGVPRKDPVEARTWYLKAIEGEDGMAMQNMGQLYLKGLGVKQNYDTALSWFHKGAAHDSAEAIGSVGYMYDVGYGVKQDYAKAMAWYQRASDKGNAVAMMNIGLMYEGGKGVTKSYEQAMVWYRKAAGKDNAEAMDHVADLYFKGLGVTQNLNLAREWYRKAAILGDATAKQWLATDGKK